MNKMSYELKMRVENFLKEYRELIYKYELCTGKVHSSGRVGLIKTDKIDRCLIETYLQRLESTKEFLS